MFCNMACGCVMVLCICEPRPSLMHAHQTCHCERMLLQELQRNELRLCICCKVLVSTVLVVWAGMSHKSCLVNMQRQPLTGCHVQLAVLGSIHRILQFMPGTSLCTCCLCLRWFVSCCAAAVAACAAWSCSLRLLTWVASLPASPSCGPA